MSRRNPKANNKSKGKDDVKQFVIQLNLTSLSVIITIISALFMAGAYIGRTSANIASQDAIYKLQCEILQLKETIVSNKEDSRIKEEELLSRIRSLSDENSALKLSQNGK